MEENRKKICNWPRCMPVSCLQSHALLAKKRTECCHFKTITSRRGTWYLINEQNWYLIIGRVYHSIPNTLCSLQQACLRNINKMRLVAFGATSQDVFQLTIFYWQLGIKTQSFTHSKTII
jgi:hypothetical protein